MNGSEHSTQAIFVGLLPLPKILRNHRDFFAFVDHLDTNLREFTAKTDELHPPDNAYAITPPPMLAGIQT